MRITLGTRGSKLALTQAKGVQRGLTEVRPGIEVELKIIKTKGDKILDSPLSRIDDKGLFVKEIETALIERKIDLGVHSFKDLPTQQPERLQVSAVPSRETPYDAFVSNSYAFLKEVPAGSVIGTSSLRRKSQLLHLRPDLVVKDIRGNIDTRLRKIDQGEYAGLVLAAAGLKRLGLERRIMELLALETMVPAVGQGALALETRRDDLKIISLCQLLNHEDTCKAVAEERDFLWSMGGGCQVPVGCYARFENNDFWIIGFIGDLEGKERLFQVLIRERNQYAGSGRVLAARLLESGGAEILTRIRQ